jgi:hypothetical protein
LALVVFVACGSDDKPAAAPTPIPTVAPTATPDPTPVPNLSPITIDLDEDIAGFIAALPDDERQCVADVLGEDGFQQLMAGGMGLPEGQDSDALSCLSNDTFLRLFTGVVQNETGVVLSDATVVCMSERAAGFSVANLLGIAGAAGLNADNEQAVDTVIGEALKIFPVLFCLNDVERSQIEAGPDGLFGAEAGLGTIDSLECAFDSIGAEGLAKFGALADGGDPPPELITMLTSVIGECGPTLAESGLFDIGGLEDLLGSDLSAIPEIPDVSVGDTAAAMELAPEVLACLSASMTDEELAALTSGASGPPDATTLLAIAECGIDAAEQAGQELPFDAEQMRCLVEAVGEDKLNAILAGEATPDFTLIGAVLSCGVSLDDFGS